MRFLRRVGSPATTEAGTNDRASVRVVAALVRNDAGDVVTGAATVRGQREITVLSGRAELDVGEVVSK
jgi:hypothetical protein